MQKHTNQADSMEEDAGTRLVHDDWTDTTLVDFNRTSVPVEIVSEPGSVNWRRSRGISEAPQRSAEIRPPTADGNRDQ